MKKSIFLLLLIVALHYTVKGQTKQQVYDYCLEIGIHRPEFVTAQVMLETDYLNPVRLGVRYKNLLCFKWGDFLTFESWQESINYYDCWMKRKGLYFYKDLETLLINEWGAGDMQGYVNDVKWIERNY